MKATELWRVFAETGDPMAYLLYRGTARPAPRRGDQEPKKRPGQAPRAED